MASSVAQEIGPGGGNGSPYAVHVVDAAKFSARRMHPLRHSVDKHPLFQLDALADLAARLMPTEQCRFLLDSGGKSFSHGPQHPQGWSLDETFRRMEEPGSWLALYNVQTQPEYAQALERIVDDLRPVIEPEEPGIFLVTGFIFISAPPAVTPFHIDRENNFWLQLRGRKTMSVWDDTDRDIIPAAAIENFISSGAQVPFEERFRSRGHDFDVGPGDGVYFPSTSPHMTRTDTRWVKPGDGISVSLGINFYTSVTRRAARVHQLNRVMRRFGMQPTFPGSSPALDAVKAPLGRWLTAARHRRLRIAPPPGVL